MAVDPTSVLRLNMPQWQGGDRPAYGIRGRVLAAIAPEPLGPVETVPVRRAAKDERPVGRGIVSRAALLEQLDAARAAIRRHAPEAIVTLGGDCHVDLAPIGYLRICTRIMQHGVSAFWRRGGARGLRSSRSRYGPQTGRAGDQRQR